MKKVADQMNSTSILIVMHCQVLKKDLVKITPKLQPCV